MKFNNVMEYDRRNRRVYDELLELCKLGKVVPFVGAGMSADAGFKLWRKFLEDEYSEFMDNQELPKSTADTVDLFKAASDLVTNLGDYFFDDIKREFGGDFSQNQWIDLLRRIKKKAVAFLPELFQGIVVTTNFDRLLEQLYPGVVVLHPKDEIALNDYVGSGKSAIFKLHGCASKSEHIILTRESYDNAYLSEGGTEYVRQLENIFIRNTLLFLGCSLQDDYTVNHWKRILTNPKVAGIKHFAIFACSPSEIKQERNRLRKDFNISAILYDGNKNHEAVRVILEQLWQDMGGNKSSSNNPAYNLPKKNEHFSGRTTFLNNLEEGFRSSLNITQVISGLGGMGKTQIALAYAHKYSDEYPNGVCWLDAENEESLSNGCCWVLEQLQKIISMVDTPEERLRLWHKWLTWHRDRLLIFDNAEDSVLVSRYIPSNYSGHIIITTQDATWNYGIIKPLEPMTKDEAVDFMIKKSGGRINENQREKVLQVAERLGFLPLAQEHAVAYICNTDLNIEAYLTKLELHGLRMLDEHDIKESDYYKKVVTTTWQLALDKIDEKNPTISKLFKILAYVAPENIPLDVFSQYSDLLPEDVNYLLTNDIALDKAMGLLRKFSLIERDKQKPNLINIHRLVQEVGRWNLLKKSDYSFLEYCNKVFDSALSLEYGSLQLPRDLFELVVKHALISFEYNMRIHSDGFIANEKMIYIYLQIGRCQYELMNYSKALEWYQKALEICKINLGDKHHTTAEIYNRIAFIYNIKGQYTKALKLYEKAFSICENSLECDSRIIANTYHGIACVHDKQGMYVNAMKLHLKALEIRLNILGAEHHDIAESYHCIACVYDNQGEYAKSLEYNLRALNIREKICGKEHPITAKSYNRPLRKLKIIKMCYNCP